MIALTSFVPLLLLCSCLGIDQVRSCPCAWRKGILKQLYDTTEGANWIDPWVIDSPEAPCSYSGVFCVNGDVVTLNIGARNLQGPFPAFLTELGNLSSLQLQVNGLTGTLPDGEMGGWKTSMVNMNIESLQITGSLPESWSQLTSLRWINFRNNPKLTGATLPASYSSWRPEYVDGGACGFTGPIPPTWSQWGAGIKTFTFDANQLTGGIPDTLSTWVNIETFQVNGNLELGGTLPESFSTWTRVGTFFVSFCGITGPIPSSYSSWTTISVFYLDRNQLSGSLPASWSRWTNVTQVHLQRNNLTGMLPHEYSSWGASLLDFTVNVNSLTGTIPASYANWSMLQRFLCGANNLTGTVPEVFSLWGSSLTAFRVAGNALSGTLHDSFSSWTSLAVIELDSNEFSGTLPASYAHWNRTLKEFYASSNRLEGSFPSEYSAWFLIERLFVYSNYLSGTLSPAFSNWRLLQRIMLSNNRLSGSLPNDYSLWGFPLNIVYMTNNSFSGTLPASWANLKNISELVLDFNQLSGSIPLSWATMIQLGTLMLNNNRLTGTIPTQFGNLKNLQFLMLNHNHLQGTLPSSIQWTQMFVVTLQNNSKLGGNIPPSWTNGFLPLSRIMAVCGTRLCGTAAVLGLTFPCFPSVQLIDMTVTADNAVATRFMNLLITSPSLPKAPCTSDDTSTQSLALPEPVVPKQPPNPPEVASGASAAATAANMACVFTGGCSASGFAVVQGASAAARLAYRCAAAQYAEDNGEDAAKVALSAADSPTQLTLSPLGDTAGPAAGTMVGNTAIVVASGVLMHAVELARQRMAHGRGGEPSGSIGVRALESLLDLLGHDLLPGSSAGFFVMFLQPTLSACVTVLTANDLGVGVRIALALPCIALWVGAIASVGYVVHARVSGAVAFVAAAARRGAGGGTARATRRHASACVEAVFRRAQAVRSFAWEPSGAWTWRRGDAGSRWYAHHFGAFFRMYSARRRTYVAVDCSFIALCGLVAGAAEATGSSASAACFAMQWGAGTLAALTTAVVCLFAYLRPVLTRIDTASYVALGVLAVASEVAAATGDETTSNGFAVGALALQLALVVASMVLGATWRDSVLGPSADPSPPKSLKLVELVDGDKERTVNKLSDKKLLAGAGNADVTIPFLFSHNPNLSQSEQLKRLVVLASKVKRRPSRAE